MVKIVDIMGACAQYDIIVHRSDHDLSYPAHPYQSKHPHELLWWWSATIMHVQHTPQLWKSWTNPPHVYIAHWLCAVAIIGMGDHVRHFMHTSMFPMTGQSYVDIVLRDWVQLCMQNHLVIWPLLDVSFGHVTPIALIMQYWVRSNLSIFLFFRVHVLATWIPPNAAAYHYTKMATQNAHVHTRWPSQNNRHEIQITCYKTR